MNVGLVIPAHGRYAVTRLACSGMAWLVDRLAVRGITAQVVLIADDRNIAIAREFSFDTIDMENQLGAKVNAGIAHLRARGADWVCFSGSDDWLHPKIFDSLLENETAERVIAGKQIAIVDVPRGALRTLNVNSRVGAGPWLIPTSRLPKEPCEPQRVRGIDGSLERRLIGSPPFVFSDPHPVARVDFKTSENISSYRQLQFLGYGPERDAFEALDEHYPAWLVDVARATSEELAQVAA